ncbi:MAG: DUF550 domain-containing protein [Cohaesibacter sp.]|nr:DUF550 domain-containing protein [Cohaesibacter sp.]
MKFDNIIDLLTDLKIAAETEQDISDYQEDIEAALSIAKAEQHNDFETLWDHHARWSDTTFGSDMLVGPIGPLKHLKKEADETLANPDNLEEYADCLMLLMDATRRAGFSPGILICAARLKLEVNKARKWPAPKDGEPRHHIKEGKEQ